MAASVLVTGGLGFIGSRLCDALLDEGCDVRCVDDLSGRYAPVTGAAAASGLAARGAEVAVERADAAHVRSMDAVVHLAGLPGVRTKHPSGRLHDTNVALPERLATAARARRARFVLLSSSSVYGNANVLPTPEDTPPKPLNPYATSKAAAEQAVLACGGDAVIVRPFTAYGPGQRPEMAFARWIRAIAAGGPVPWHAAPGTARDFTYVDDAVAGILPPPRRGRSGEAYNLSGWRSVDLREALALLEPSTVLELPASPAEAHVTHGCGRTASAELGYTPRVGLREGLESQLAAATPRSIAA